MILFFGCSDNISVVKKHILVLILSIHVMITKACADL